MMTYHRTPNGKLILAEGFRDGEGTYMTRAMHRGVWLSDRPLSFFEGAKGDDLLLLDIPEEVLQPYEWVEEGKPYREFLVPAETVNSFGPPAFCDDEEDDWLTPAMNRSKPSGRMEA